ncbi:MAG TPA: hypothetical protein VEU33_27950 [Archangium sp.]|nr:hypothetical protein [Archangium sp.]
MNGTATTFDPNTTPPTTLSTTNIHSTTKPDGTVTTTHTTSRNGNLLSTTTITITTESDNTVTTKSTTIAEPDGAVPRTTTIDTTTTKPDGSVLRIITIDSTRRSGSSVVRTLHKTTIHPDGSRVTTTADSATSYGILKFTWSVGSPSRSSVQELTDTKGKLVKRMVALTPPLPKQSQSAADDGLSGTRVDLLFLATDDLPIDSSRTPSPLRFHHLQGIHKSGEQNQDLMLPVNRVETTGITGDDLSACWSYDKQNKNYQLESLIIGADGIRHGRYIETWGFTSSKLNDKSADAILAASRTGDDRVHAVWRDKGEASPLKYRWIEGERWSDPIVLMENCPLSEGPQNFGVVINGTALIDLFLATPDGLHQLKLEADKTRALVNQKGLRRFISDSTELLERVDEFIHAGSSQVQADTQNVRQLMISGTTEASRLVVSPILGATMVQSPLAARSDIESFLSYFHRKREALLGLAASTPDEIDVLQDARETLEQATSTRRDLTERLIRFVEELGLDVTNMALLGIAVYSDGFERDLADGELSGAHRVLFETNTKIVTRESILVSDLVKDPFKLKTVLARIEQEPNALAKAIGNLGTLEWKASDYFSTSVQHLENALVLLQEMEGRMGPHHQSLDDYKRVHVGLERDWAALKKRLEAVERELAEARQDVTIARSLLAEEESRITGINQRRKQLFDQHVPFLVFQRPRECELTRETPSRELEPGRVKEFQPEVLASTAAAPPEVLAYVELIRDSPLTGFTVTRKLLDGLDRLELIQRTFEWAQVRAVHRLPIHLPVLPSNPTSYAQGLFHLLSAREQLIAQQRGTFVHFSRAALYNRPLRELQQLAGELLSLGDLIDTAQGRPEVGQGAATELALIAKVATALYERFGQVLPVIRMEWAERMSQYDAPVNLHNLSRLPRWAEIDGTARREMQTLVDWLFQRVVPIQREAFYLMNDLVRTCMLLASHAPVNELLSGELSKTTMARVGGSLELKVTQMRVRIGMHVVVRTTEQTVQAVVVDLSSGLVRARVLSTSAAMVQLPEKTPAFFSEPARGTGTLLPYVGARR